MPAANPAASTQPSTQRAIRPDPSRRLRRRIAALLIALPVAASFVIAQPPTGVYAQASPSGCARWHSLTQPPDTIRVLRTRSNNVQTVSFRRYVLIVLAKEWPSYLPQQVVEAGAVAVKQYAWYHAIYTSRSSRGGCFDVKDGTGDQIYRPRNNRPSDDHFRALDATWNVSLRKSGSFFMTAYRRGAKVRCGRDANGSRLYALSAKHCAERHGYSWRRILREYYSNVSFVEGGGGSSARRVVLTPTATPDSADQNAPSVNEPQSTSTSETTEATSTTDPSDAIDTAGCDQRLQPGSNWTNRHRRPHAARRASRERSPRRRCLAPDSFIGAARRSAGCARRRDSQRRRTCTAHRYSVRGRERDLADLDRADRRALVRLHDDGNTPQEAARLPPLTVWSVADRSPSGRGLAGPRVYISADRHRELRAAGDAVHVSRGGFE